jgi:FAD/FMN-containing dehydrogenase
VNEVDRRLQGSFAAEHGIGQLKAGMLATWHSDVELELMRRLKKSLDPYVLLNPGKLLKSL